MSKTLLNESEIRKFMKLSNLAPLRETFLSRLEEQEMADEEAPEGEDPGAEMGGEMGGEMDLGGEEEAPEGEEPAGEDESMEAAVEQVVSAVVDALKDLPGAPSISMETEEGGEEEMEMGGEEEEMEMGAEEEGGEEEGGEEEEALMEAFSDAGIFLEEEDDVYGEDIYGEGLGIDADEEELAEGYEDEEDPDVQAEAYLDEDELVNEVTRRVGARLLRRLRR